VRDGHAEAVIVSVAVVVRVDDVEAELVRVAVALRDGIAAISAPKEVARHARIIIQRHDARTRNILKIIVDETHATVLVRFAASPTTNLKSSSSSNKIYMIYI
jgi:hypothetical protein